MNAVTQDEAIILAGCSLNVSPKKNWVEKKGGLPPYVCAIAKGIMRSGRSRQTAIQMAIGRVKVWAAGGGNVKADTRAKAAKAVAQWEKMKLSAHKLAEFDNDTGDVLILSATLPSFSMDAARAQYQAMVDEEYRGGGSFDEDVPVNLWVKEVWSDFLVVSGDGGELFKVPFEVKDGTFEFGDEEPVVMVPVPAEFSDEVLEQYGEDEELDSYESDEDADDSEDVDPESEDATDEDQEMKFSGRKVRTPAGARFYGAPIGTPIVKDKVTGKLKAVTKALDKATTNTGGSLADVRERADSYPGEGSPKNPKRVNGDIEAAALLLSEGKSIRLESPMEVGTLIDKLAEIVEDAKKRGDKAPDYDLCLSGETGVMTPDGNIPIRDLAAAGRATLLTRRPNGGPADWVEAEVRSFGVHPLKKITFSRSGQIKEVFATDNHRWFVRTGKRYKDNRTEHEVTTAGLEPGMRVPSVYARQVHTKACGASTGISPSPFGVLHGFTFGDGCAPAKEEQPAHVVLYGDKDAQLMKWFPPNVRTSVHVEPGQHGYNVQGIKVKDLPRYYKQSPLGLDETKAYLFGWLAGYFAADGCVSTKGAPSLSSADRENLVLAQTIANRLGFPTFSITTVSRVGKGDDPSDLHTLSFQTGRLPEDFFLLDEHRQRAAVTPVLDRSQWTVISVEDTDRVEEVFCAVVPQTGAFVLADNMLTGNCKVSVPKTSLFCAQNIGIPRAKMPQFKGKTASGDELDVEEGWRSMLHDKGIKITRKTVPAAELKASQTQLDGVKVSGMATALEDPKLPKKNRDALTAPIFVTKDGYVLDGHHRWAAIVATDVKDGKLGDTSMGVDIIDIEIGEAIDLANAYTAARGIVPKGLGKDAEGVAKPPKA